MKILTGTEQAIHNIAQFDDGNNPLPPEVTQAYLADYPAHQLEARKLSFEREALFERSTALRRALTAEAARTQIEIDRRKEYLKAEADRCFA